MSLPSNEDIADHIEDGTTTTVAFVTSALVVGLLIGIYIGSRLADSGWRSSSIRNGVGEYNSKTGAWQWKPLPIPQKD